jgi:N-acetyl-anhydromuramyl-L-alanine amidase AmpD
MLYLTILKYIKINHCNYTSIKNMRFRDWATRVMLIFLMFAALILVLFIGKVKKLPHQPITSNPDNTISSQYPQAILQSAKDVNQYPVQTNQSITRYVTTQAFSRYKPKLELAAVHPSNYGERSTKDVNDLPVNNQAIVVLHETGYSATSAINFFQAANQDENVQASYHALIKQDGTVVYLVPPDKRAFGAGNSVFHGANGPEAVQTNPNLPASVNNFAYHVSLETPPDGQGEKITSHSGYTDAQYNSLAWLIAQSQVPDERITTHKAVDIAGKKVDPINFDGNKFLRILHAYRQVRTVNTARK